MSYNFDNSDDDSPFNNFNKIFKEIQEKIFKMLENMDFDKLDDNSVDGEPHIRKIGFSVNMGPDGKFEIKPIGDLGNIDPEELENMMKNSINLDGADFKNMRPEDFMKMFSGTGMPFPVFNNSIGQNQNIFDHNENGWEEPYTEVHIMNEQYLIVSEVPGIEKKDVKIKIKDKEIEIVAEHSDRKYKKQLSFNNKVDAKSLEYEVRNGILEIKLKMK